MTNVKTAVSISRPLYEEAEKLATELKVSRSRLYALALRRLLDQQHNQHLLDRLNRAYAETPPTDKEARLLDAMRQQQRRLVEDEG